MAKAVAQGRGIDHRIEPDDPRVSERFHMDPNTLRELFAANLRRLRYNRQISQEDLAYFAEVNRTYISKLEKGACYPGLAIIAKLAAVLEVEPAELLKPLPNAVSGEASEKPVLLPIDQTKALPPRFEHRRSLARRLAVSLPDQRPPSSGRLTTAMAAVVLLLLRSGGARADKE